MSRTIFPLVWLALLAGCKEAERQPISIAISPAGPDTRLVLRVSSGLKVNARLDPALELADGRVVRFHSDALTPDSAYFAAPPVALLAGRRDRVHGLLRASVCDSAATVCRTVELEL